MRSMAKCPMCLRWAPVEPCGVPGAPYTFADHRAYSDYRCEGFGLVVDPSDWSSLNGDP